MLFSFLKSSHKPNPRPRQARRAFRKLSLERLESRDMPSAVFWDGGGGDYLWQNAINWSNDSQPSAGDEVQIGSAFAAATITSTSNVSINSLASEAGLAISGGVFSIANTSTINNTLNVSSATLAGAGDLTVSRALTMNGGTVLGPGRLAVSGGVTLDGGNALGRTLDSAGASVLLGGALDFVDGGFFNNLAGATFEVRTGAADVQYGSLLLHRGTTPGSTGFHNAGLFLKADGLETRVGVDFDNDGVVKVSSGLLRLIGGGEGSGAFTVAEGGTLLLAGTPTMGGGSSGVAVWTLDADSSVSGSGIVRFGDAIGVYATATVAGLYNVTGSTIIEGGSHATEVDFTGRVDSLGAVSVNASATLDLSGATLTAGGGDTLASLNFAGGTLVAAQDLSVTGTFTGSEGTLQGVASQGSLTVSSDMTLNGAYLVRDFNLINAGDAIWSGGTVNFYGNSRFTNLAAATFDDQIDGSFGGSQVDCPIFENQGLFIKSGDTGTTYLGMQLVNRGTVRIDSGRLFVGCGYVQDNPSPLPPGVDLPPGEGPGIIIDDPTPLPPSPTPPPVFTSYTQTVTGVLIEQIAGHTPPAEFGIPGVDYGQLVILGDVQLAGSFEVQLLNGFVPAAEDKFLVIDNQGSNPIGGNFDGLPEGAIVFTGVYGFTISYIGGDGNDVVLTVAVVQATPTVTAAWSGWTYDGTAHAASGSVSGINSDDLGAPTSFTYYVGTGTLGTNLGETAPSDAGTYTVVAHYDGSYGYTAADSDPVTVTIDQAAPVFSITSTTIIIDGTSTVTLSGVLRAGSLVPTGLVTVALAGVGSQEVAIQSDGTFAATFGTGSLAVGAHAVTFDYAGDQNFTATEAGGMLDDTYGVKALIQKAKYKKKGTSLSVQVELLTASGQNVSAASIGVTAVGIGAAAPGDAEGSVGVVQPADVGTLTTTLSDAFKFQNGNDPSYVYQPKNLNGLTSGTTYRLYFQVEGDPLLHWVAFTM
jgi:fibronectin-binding autotransporter adhesin